MRLSHDVPMAGHLGITKMKDRILQRYYWPGIFKDVVNYCRGCEVCQRSTPRKPAKAGLVPIPIVTHPFQCIEMEGHCGTFASYSEREQVYPYHLQLRYQIP